MTTRQDRADRDAEIMHMHASGLSSTAIAERVGVSRTRVWQITSGYYDRTESANPTTAHRWTRPDGSFDVLAWCRHLDNQWNVGAGSPRTCPTQTGVRGSVGSNESDPGAASTALGPANPDETGASK